MGIGVPPLHWENESDSVRILTNGCNLDGEVRDPLARCGPRLQSGRCPVVGGC